MAQTLHERDKRDRNNVVLAKDNRDSGSLSRQIKNVRDSGSHGKGNGLCPYLFMSYLPIFFPIIFLLIISASAIANAQTVIATVPMGSGQRGVGVNPNTNRVYVATNSDTVSVIDGATNQVIATVPVGSISTYNMQRR